MKAEGATRASYCAGAISTVLAFFPALVAVGYSFMPFSGKTAFKAVLCVWLLSILSGLVAVGFAIRARRLGQVWPRSSLLLCIPAGLVLLLIVALVYLIPEDRQYPARAFSTQAWITKSPTQQVDRACMCEDLDSRFLKKGMTKTQVVQLLGQADFVAPNAEMYKPDPNGVELWWYTLAKRKNDFDGASLFLTFDKNGLLSDWREHHE